MRACDERHSSPLKEHNPLASWVDTLCCFQTQMLFEPPACQCSWRLGPEGRWWWGGGGELTDVTLLFIEREVIEHLSSLFPSLLYSLSLSLTLFLPLFLTSRSPKMGHWEVSIIRITLHKPGRNVHIHIEIKISAYANSRTHPHTRMQSWRPFGARTRTKRRINENPSPTRGFQTWRTLDISVS